MKNCWLSGFTDAEGYFTCSIKHRLDRLSTVRLRYILSQKGHKEEMDYLANILNGNTHYIKSFDGYNMTVNTGKLSLLVKYFNSFSLKTKKYVVYYNWKKSIY